MFDIKNKYWYHKIMKKTGKLETCKNCGKSFYVPKWWKEKGAKFCSRKCYGENKKGCIPWNKGLRGSVKRNGGSFASGKIAWRGTIEDYKALHHWVGKYLGKPEICSSCGKIKKGRGMHWANKSGKYKKEGSDWLRLCAKCHYKFDKQNERREKNFIQD